MNTMKRYDDLTELLAHVWDYLEQGARRPKHAFHTPTLVSTGPHARTVVLRETDRHARRLTCHSDRRAKKIRDIEQTPDIVWHGWDKKKLEQFRLSGHATLHSEGARADQQWQKTSPRSLAIYAKPIAPDTVVSEPQDGLADAVRKDDLTHDDVVAGRENFAVIDTEIRDITWLHLHPDGHYSARFVWDGEKFLGNWLIP
ncbi:MAG: pyridoxamine 5'-phosphate oxidase family protein [Trueperaceae bacterium]|nr:pyridoxamine 5'-phosphate oxidase family protein [Trueperaceae bacterium]